nr:MAG TPA: hypothetical protein [Caudoviricetes sp.]
MLRQTLRCLLNIRIHHTIISFTYYCYSMSI